VGKAGWFRRLGREALLADPFDCFPMQAEDQVVGILGHGLPPFARHCTPAAAAHAIPTPKPSPPFLATTPPTLRCRRCSPRYGVWFSCGPKDQIDTHKTRALGMLFDGEAQLVSGVEGQS
jgi:hypothetical protein